MKKMLLAVSVFCIQYTQAQTVVDFEDLTPPGADTAWLGSDMAGGFTSRGVFFENTYNTQYHFWNGFVYSNSTDVTTAGASNDFSAYTGNGANGSANYAVFNNGSIDFGSEKVLSSIKITNTTYAALSMLNGDAYGKQFGSPNSAAGAPDGTNGADWFRLYIIGKDAQSNTTDTVTFYLADYRFANNTQDYIVNTWQTVDLTPLGEVKFLEFELASSDVGQFGMNTPAYFAFDNLTYGTASINELSVSTQEIYPNPTTGLLTVQSEAGQIKVFSLTGELILEQTTNGTQEMNLNHVNAGTYFVETTSAKGTARTRISKI